MFWKWSILVPLPPLPLPRFRFRFYQNVVILLVAIPPTYLGAADKTNGFRFRFQNPVADTIRFDRSTALETASGIGPALGEGEEVRGSRVSVQKKGGEEALKSITLTTSGTIIDSLEGGASPTKGE